MRFRQRLPLLVLALVEIAVVIAAVSWLNAYFHPPHAAARFQVAFRTRYSGVQMVAEMGQILLSLVVCYAVLEGVAGRERGLRWVMKLLPVAAVAALILVVVDVNALYSFHGVMEAIAKGSHVPPGLSSSVSSVNDAVLRTGVLVAVSWTVVRLAAYAGLRWYLTRPAGPAAGS